MLDDLVLGVGGTASSDEGVTVAEDGDGILADVAEPDVGQGAGTLAVDTLEGVGANDDVAEGSTVLEDEDGGVRASVGVGVAGLATVELLVASVERAGDGGRLGERDDAAGAGRDVEGLAHGKASHGGGDDNVGEEHFGVKVVGRSDDRRSFLVKDSE